MKQMLAQKDDAIPMTCVSVALASYSTTSKSNMLAQDSYPGLYYVSNCSIADNDRANS